MDDQPSLFAALWRFKFLIAGAAILAAVAGYFLSAQSPAVYRAEGLVLLTDPRTGNSAATELSLFWNPTRYLSNQAEVMRSPIVLDRAAESLGGDITAEDLADDVSVSPATDVDALNVDATAGDTQSPVDMVNAVVEAYGEVTSEEVLRTAEVTTASLESTKAQLQARLVELDALIAENPDDSALDAERQSTRESLIDVDTRIKDIETQALLYGTGIQLYIDPQPPAAQIAPTPARNAAIAFVLAALAAGAFAWWRAEQDQRADSKDVAARVLDAPLLASVPDFSLAKAWAPAPTVTNPDSSAAEAFHFALSSLSFVLEERGGRSVVITSAGPGDGKTVTALNLAIAAMKDGRRPLLIDADERMQGLTTLAGIADHPSPNGRIGHGYEWPITAEETIDFIAAGRDLGADVSGYFRSVEFRRAFHDITAERDLVIVDAPPVMSASETAELAAEVDAVVLVVDRGTPLRHLEDARERIELTGTPIVGYVFNRADNAGSGYYAYGYAAPKPKQPKATTEG